MDRLFKAINIRIYTVTPEHLTSISHFLSKVVQFVLTKVVTPLIPIFVFGFFIKVIHDGTILNILKSYSYIFFVIISTGVSYALLWYFILMGRDAPRALKNMLPAIFVGFTTMSGGLALPLIIDGARKNIGKSAITEMILPPAINFHLLGDGLAICMIALCMMASSGSFPEFIPYLGIAFFLTLAKFAAAAVPGGGVFALGKTLETKLHLSKDSISILTAIILLFDCFNTAVNVMGHGAFAIAVTKLYRKIDRIKNEAA